VNKILGQDLVEVIGTFVDGVLHGNAKFVLANKWVVIASFINGLAEGLRREWDERGNLVPIKHKPFSFVIHTCSK
jgi:antitoxin component YwqK of YwqJK toxin-antitoxin module